ncbi:MAG: thioesterase [Alicyclobacillus sp. RIFOXYA1_FULL_53_8]|nr:MAG: thioesterase [Alicyclobacillus sp. RIFOXYA1_FULL_53_8]
MPAMVTTEIEVRWGECDAAGIVYHPVYIDWFSVARMRFMKENGVSYMESFHDSGIVLVVLEAQGQYRKTLRAEDKAFVEAKLVERSRTRLKMEYEVYNEQRELCTVGHTEHAFVDMASNKAVNLAKRAPELWNLVLQMPLTEKK